MVFNLLMLTLTMFQETIGKTQSMQMTFRNPPENYFFMSWNWPLIRKFSLWLFLSTLVAMLALVIALIVSLPKRCNPSTEWYQGSVLYEIFPGSYADSNGDTIGDFRGLTAKTDYILSLGVKGVRLNSIFACTDYPDDYKNVTSLTEIAKPLGTIRDFGVFANALHARNLSLILDLPLHPLVKHLSANQELLELNKTELKPAVEFLKTKRAHQEDMVSQALIYWQSHGVDGFYLKGLEQFVNDSNFPSAIRYWKKLVGQNRALIVSNKVVKTVPKVYLNVLLNNVDLVDVPLNMESGVAEVSKAIDSELNGTLFSKPGAPWIQWSLGDVDTVRLSNRLHYGNATLGALLLQLMLPGTPSVFYGDEVGLRQVLDVHNDRKDTEHMHQLGAMAWLEPQRQFTLKGLLPWLHGSPTTSNFAQLELVEKMVAFRAESPSIYMNAVFKDEENKANAEVKYSKGDMLVIQRWYPRRKSYVVVSNLGDSQVTNDLSTLLYGGQVVVGPRAESRSEAIVFNNVSLWPGESVVILLD